MKILKSIWKYTLGHPFTWDCAVGGAAFITMNLGWFKPWVPLACILALLGHIYWLRKALKKFTV